jgi:hypothetical protein
MLAKVDYKGRRSLSLKASPRYNLVASYFKAVVAITSLVI